VVGPNESSKSAAKSLVVAGEGNEVEKVAAAAAAGAAAWFALGASEAAIEPPRSSIRLPAALFAEMAGENDEEDGDEDEKEEGDDEDGGGEAAAPLLRILAARRRCMSASALSAACCAFTACNGRGGSVRSPLEIDSRHTRTSPMAARAPTT